MTLFRFIALAIVILFASPTFGQILIDFDRLPDGSPTPKWENVDNSYSSLGVTFRSLSSEDSTPPYFGDYSGWASSTIAQDFSTVPHQPFNIVAEFSNPVTSISVDARAPTSYFLRMTARNEAGEDIGIVDSLPGPIANQGKITLNNIGPIKSVVWTVPDPFPGAPKGGVGIDNLVFTPQISRLESRLPALTGAQNIVIVTHGRDAEYEWVEEMVDSIESSIATNHPNETSQWQVIPYNWTDIDNGLPDNVLATAIDLGAREGSIIGKVKPKHVHLIGHSAGAGFVHSATQVIEASSRETTTHATYLDAYAPGSFENVYGQLADWAEHYVNRNDLLWTNEILPNAHNIDITNLAGNGDHSWPREFYQRTITQTQPEWAGYGFPLSLEGTIFEPDTYGINQVVTLPLQGPPQPTPQTTTRLDEEVNFQNSQSISSQNGVDIMAHGISLETNSPSWVIIDLGISDPVNLLRFNLEFTSGENAEGLLAVYLDNMLIGTIDERFAPIDNHEYTFTVPDIAPGAHRLGLSLEPYSQISSRAVISNLRTGFTSVIPEPTSKTLIYPAILALFLWRRLHRKS